MTIKEWLAKVLDVKPEIRYNDRTVVETQEVVKYQIVEVPMLRTQSGWNKELKETVATLNAHPGFVALIDRLALQAAALKTKLNSERHKEIRDVEFIQSGIFWCNWLQNQVNAATTRLAPRRQDAAAEDEAALKEIQATYNLAGE